MRAFIAKRIGWAGLSAALFLCAVAAPAWGQGANIKRNAKDGAEMVLIPAGEYQMGYYDQKDNQPHKATVSAFYIYKNVVTVAQYKKFCKATGHKMPPAPAFNPNWSKLDHPIVNVSWADAKAYCDWAGARLPTEAQWEKAAKGTDGRKYPWGNDYDPNKVWGSKKKEGDAGGTTAVGRYTNGPYGLSDMEGNVWQWCSDWYDDLFWERHREGSQDMENTQPSKWRVLRGGGWKFYDDWDFNCAFRHQLDPNDRQNYVGFRCVMRVSSP